MRAKLDDPISVIWSFEATTRKVRIHKLHWQQRDYVPQAIDFHHRSQQGNTLLHIFSVSDVQAGLCFKLVFNTRFLTWTLAEVADAFGS